MEKVIKLGPKAYLVDTTTDEVVYRYDPNKSLEFRMEMDDGSMVRVNSSNIHEKYGGQIVFNMDDNTYVLDDGFQDVLTSAGYIVYANFDTEQETNKDAGFAAREAIYSDILSCLNKIRDEEENLDMEFTRHAGKNIEFAFRKGGFDFTVYIDTVNNIVTKNQERKLNGLAFYPFDKSVDKYNAYYVSIFAKRIDEHSNNGEKYNLADAFIADLIQHLNESDNMPLDYHYKSLNIKRRILKYKGI